MNRWFTSDQHFHHRNIIEYENRPFDSIEEMNAAIIENSNKLVKPKDELYILGDFALCNGLLANTLLQSLNGKKYLLKGSHDTFLKYKNFDSSLFEWVKDYYELKVNKTKFILCHYPFYSWNAKFHGSIHLYGHVHSRIPDLNDTLGAYNVGVDVNDMKPVSLDSMVDRERIK